MGNTEIRLFRFGDGEFDYLLHEYKDGEKTKVLYIFFNEMNDPESILETLREQDYRIIISPLQEEMDSVLYGRSKVRLGDIEGELEDLQGGSQAA